MYDHEHPAYKKLQEIGREITSKVKPRAVVVFSAHWQGGRDTVEVNTAEVTELIYEYASSQFLVQVSKEEMWDCADHFSFYGFPGHYYKEKYPNVGSQEVAQKVINAIKDAGISVHGVKRGLDHGVWSSFKCGTYLCPRIRYRSANDCWGYQSIRARGKSP